MNTQFNPVTPDNFTRITLDVYGNPRYVLHFTNLTTLNDRREAKNRGVIWLNILYDVACKRANKIGGKKYRGKRYGGGVVFQSYNIADTCERINALLSELN